MRKGVGELRQAPTRGRGRLRTAAWLSRWAAWVAAGQRPRRVCSKVVDTSPPRPCPKALPPALAWAQALPECACSLLTRHSDTCAQQASARCAGRPLAAVHRARGRQRRRRQRRAGLTCIWAPRSWAAAAASPWQCLQRPGHFMKGCGRGPVRLRRPGDPPASQTGLTERQRRDFRRARRYRACGERFVERENGAAAASHHRATIGWGNVDTSREGALAAPRRENSSAARPARATRTPRARRAVVCVVRLHIPRPMNDKA